MIIWLWHMGTIFSIGKYFSENLDLLFWRFLSNIFKGNWIKQFCKKFLVFSMVAWKRNLPTEKFLFKIYWIYRGISFEKTIIIKFFFISSQKSSTFFFFKISQKILSSWNSFEKISKNQKFSMNSCYSCIFGKILPYWKNSPHMP